MFEGLQLPDSTPEPYVPSVQTSPYVVSQESALITDATNCSSFWASMNQFIVVCAWTAEVLLPPPPPPPPPPPLLLLERAKLLLDESWAKAEIAKRASASADLSVAIMISEKLI